MNEEKAQLMLDEVILKLKAISEDKKLLHTAYRDEYFFLVGKYYTILTMCYDWCILDLHGFNILDVWGD